MNQDRDFNNNDSTSSKCDVTANLQEAIAKLEKFAEQNETAPIPHIHNLDLHNGALIAKPASPFQKTLDLTRRFIASTFSDQSRLELEQKRFLIQQELLKAIDFLKTNYPLIEKLKKGTPAQQKLADLSTQAILRYNTVINQSKKSSPSLGDRVARFLYEHSGLSIDKELTINPIEIPHHASIQYDSPSHDKLSLSKKFSQYLESSSAASSKKIASLVVPIHHSAVSSLKPTTQELDAFRMKAITMIQHHSFPSSVREALHSLKQTPVETIVASHQTSTDKSDSTVVSLHQVLTPLPGETIELKGSFKRNTTSSLVSIPIPDSFHVSSKSTQTGFPHPSQYTGWALADVLIPAYPHRWDQLPLLQKIHHRKKEAAHALLPQGSLNEKAKRLLKLKKQAFEQQAEKYLQMHNILSKAIMTASGEYNQDDLLAIDDYFQLLKQQPSPFETFYKNQQKIIDDCILTPYNAVQNEWLAFTNPQILSKESEKCFKACFDIFTSQIETANECSSFHLNHAVTCWEKASWKYPILMGSTIGKAARSIVLQHLSEKLEFAPPMLNSFEQIIQASLYKQLRDFLKELETDLPDVEQMDSFHQTLQRQIQGDISLFKTQDFEKIQDSSAEIVHELEVYYNSRYYTLLQRNAEGKKMKKPSNSE